MAWLIRRRAELKGALNARKKRLDELPGEIAALEAELVGLDGVFKLHEVKVDPTVVKGLRSHTPSVMPYGVMTKALLRCLKEANGKPLTTTAVTAYVVVQTGLELTRENRPRVTQRISARLKTMVKEGSVKRHHEVAVGSTTEGLWSLVLDDEQAMAA